MEYLYPGGLAKAITFSYDDGQVYDRRLIEIFNQAGFKGTFHLNSGNLDKDGYVQKAELPTLYAEHEIACHGVTHRHPRQMNQTEWLREVWQDRLTLEELTGGIVQGMSYAFGEYYPEQVEALCAMGIQYSRTVESTGSFALPQELLRWKPTATTMINCWNAQKSFCMFRDMKKCRCFISGATALNLSAKTPGP